MNTIELALEKQRLQLEIARRRQEFARHATGLQPLFETADRVRAGVRWAGRHPEIVAGSVALLAALRPGVRRILWRWGKRAFFTWRYLRKNDLWPAKRQVDHQAL